MPAKIKQNAVLGFMLTAEGKILIKIVMFSVQPISTKLPTSMANIDARAERLLSEDINLETAPNFVPTSSSMAAFIFTFFAGGAELSHARE